MPRPIFVPATAAPDAGADIVAQTSMTLARLDERLRAERSSLADAVAVTVYLRQAADFAGMNDAYKQAWTALPPTRTTVVSDLVTAGARVEMSAIAVPSGAERRLVHPAAWAMSCARQDVGLVGPPGRPRPRRAALRVSSASARSWSRRAASHRPPARLMRRR